MKKACTLLILLIALINCLCIVNKNNLKIDNLQAETMHEINQDVEDNPNYKQAVFSFSSADTNQFFKYDNSTLPTSRVSPFRIDFDIFYTEMNDYKVFCTNVESSTSDSVLMDRLRYITITNSSCVDGFRSHAIYDGIVKLDPQKTKLGIVIKTNSGASFTAKLYFRVVERILGTDESRPMEEESLSLVPFTINIPSFRALDKSKILFYSSTRLLQMYYVETNNPYPEKLFSGNVLSVYTNPNMVRQKYHGASTMTLLVYPFGFYSNLGEEFKFEVKLFDSNYLLDYYVSSNSEGRPLNSPLLINMTECSSPYYVILNYNQAESEKSLVIDQIYGKMTYLSVATKFTQSTWDEMLENDMETVNINSRKHSLPANSNIHMDVYQIECELPLMFNFYYTDESDLYPKMNFGDIAIFTLKPYETVNIPFFSDIVAFYKKSSVLNFFHNGKL